MRPHLLALAFALTTAACGPDTPSQPSPSPSPSPSPVGPVPALATLAPRDCPTGTWCWMQGAPLSVAGDRDRGTVVAFGAEGYVLRWAEDRWVSLPLPDRVGVRSAWVRSATETWASDARGRAWRHSGTAWTEASATLPIARLVPEADGAPWALAGASGGAHGGSSGAHLLRWTAGVWQEPAPPYAFCMGGDFTVLDTGEIWTAGLTCRPDGAVDAVEVRRWAGGAWELVGAPIPQQGWFPSFERIGGRVHVQASGRFVWDGAAWTTAPRAEYPQGLALDQEALSDGLGYTVVPRSLGCEDGYRLDDARAWCTGAGQLYVSTATAWRPTITGVFAETSPVASWGALPPNVWAGGEARLAWGSGPRDVYRVRPSTGSQLEHYDGERWTVVLEEAVLALDGAAADDVWVATAGGVLHGDARGFTLVPIPAMVSTEPVERLRALGAQRVAVVTEHALLGYDGAWSVLYGAPNLPDHWRVGAVGGSGPDDLWVVRYLISRPFDYTVEHFDGRAWAPQRLTVEEPATLSTVAGRTWLHTGDTLVPLGTADTPVMVDLPAPFEAQVWAGGGGLWITTAHQALRREYP